jgi:hypothetical protein
MTEIGREEPAADASGAPNYEPPRIEELGTVQELTMGGVTPGADVSFIGSTSDRRLKRGITPVDASLVLAQVGALASRS